MQKVVTYLTVTVTVKNINGIFHIFDNLRTIPIHIILAHPISGQI